MTDKLLHVLQHSVGANQYGQDEHGQYRNHFCAGGGDVDLCRELVGMGCMVERPASELTGGDPLFQVTLAGRELVGFQRWVVGAYDKRIVWEDWVVNGFDARGLNNNADQLEISV